jgi:glycosyltransferase involved in cell wall biosynthesis
MKVVFLGNLAGGAYMMARPVAKCGVNACLMLARWEGELAAPGWEGRSEPDPRNLSIVRYGAQLPERGGWIIRLATHARRALSYLSQIPRMLQADVIQSFTCSLFVSRLWFLVFGVLRLRPYIACATGSDLRELAVSGTGFNAWLCRQFFKRANVVLLLNLDMQRFANQIGVKNARFFPFSVDTALFESRPVKKQYCDEEELLLFMPSHLDWGVRDNAPGRTSTKGNDRLIRAFARFISAAGKGHLLLLNRGPDRELARRLVDELGVAPHVTFRDQMMKRELIEHFNMADVVADQFDIGAFGTTTLEAMACAKPVLVYVDEGCADQCYSDRPPVLNAHSEDEILQALHKSLDAGFRSELGKQARDWVVRHHDAPSVAARLIEIYQTLREGR